MLDGEIKFLMQSDFFLSSSIGQESMGLLSSSYKHRCASNKFEFTGSMYCVLIY